jgi:hypothetical protein
MLLLELAVMAAIVFIGGSLHLREKRPMEMMPQ